MDLPLLSALFVTGSLCLYVMLDSFDLGVGALLLLERDGSRRDRMVDAIVPTWDGNETWLVMAGVALFAGFPTAYSVLMPAFYLPLIVMLLSLGLRGVSFEFRYQTVKARRRWDCIFAVGSIVAAFMQGAFVGGLIVGVAVKGGAFAGGSFDWLTPFSVLCGLVSLTGYVVLGAAWLHLKGEGKTRLFAEASLARATPVFLIFFSVACLAAVHTQSLVEEAWGRHAFSLGALGAIFLSAGLIISLRAPRSQFSFDAAPFFGGLAMFACVLLGLALTFSPDIVPFRISIWAAASPDSTQAFLLIGALIVIPVIITYSAFAYWIFRGKTPREGWSE